MCVFSAPLRRGGNCLGNGPKHNLRKWDSLSASPLLLLILTLVLPGCGKGHKAGTNEVAVGVVLPITGREAKPGQFQREGIELAIHQINQNGGIFIRELDKKLPVKEVFYDDGSDQAKSAGLVERAMTSDGVVAVLGGYSTALGEAESVMPDRYGTPWITTGAAASTNFSGLLQKVKNARADIFLADAHLQGYITMQRQYMQTGMYHQMISYGARGPESDARKALGDATNYIFAGIWWSVKLPYPQVKRFAADYQASVGRPPDSWYPATAYEAMRALASAIEQAGSLNKTAIRDQLRKVELRDSLLPGQVLRFGQNGQIHTPFVMVENKPNDQVDIVYPPDAATGEAIAPKPR